jgi:CDP-diacylglycerol--glycerol-3-phosphate 3-phosphatidyltransferase
MRLTIPNQVTLGRLALTVVFFVLLSLYRVPSSPDWLLKASFWVFLVAALGDVLDGLLARLLRQVTSFGRVLDPVVDKVMVCGAFVFFASGHFMDNGRNSTGVAPWMAVVILAREFLVSVIRARVEETGADFAALWTGKLKMFIQSVTVCIVLGQLGWHLQNLEPLRVVSIWLTVIVTVLSILSYIRRARPLLAQSSPTGPPAGPPGPPPAGAGAVRAPEPGGEART